MLDNNSPGAFTNVISYITASARTLLAELEREAGVYQTYYMDTDSLVVTHEGFLKIQKAGFIDNEELGKLKIEGMM